MKMTTSTTYLSFNSLMLARKRRREVADHGVIEWRRPKYQTIYHILKNPAYAGAYAYGKHRTLRLPGAHEQVVNRTLPMEECTRDGSH